MKLDKLNIPTLQSKKFGAVPKPTKAVKIVQAKPKQHKSPIKKMSDKRKEENKIYLKLRNEFLKVNKDCQVGQKGCKLRSIDVHHSVSGASRTRHFLDVKTWFAVCRSCHSWIHAQPLQAKELGFLK